MDEPERHEETWEEMTERVSREHQTQINVSYSANLMASMLAYKAVGFSDTQAFELTLAEHQSKLEFMGNAQMFRIVHENGEDGAEG